MEKVGKISNNKIASKYFTKINFLLNSFRIQSWVGWLAIFGAGSVLFMIPNFFHLAINTFSFSTITVAIFVQNQYFDRKSDILNPQKRSLPIASGKLSPRFSLFILVILLFSGFISIALSNIYILPLYIAYFALWSLYSTPIVHLKSQPTWDIIAAGIGSGVFPFIIGVQVSSQITLEYHLPWMQRLYLDTFLSALPIFLFQIACQIFQEISDFDADIQAKIKTFVVRSGKVTSIKVALIFALFSLVLPIIFGFLNLTHTNQFLFYYSIFLITISPLVFYTLKLMRNPTREKIERLSMFSKKFSSFILLVIFIYILLLRIYIR